METLKRKTFELPYGIGPITGLERCAEQINLLWTIIDNLTERLASVELVSEFPTPPSLPLVYRDIGQPLFAHQECHCDADYTGAHKHDCHLARAGKRR